MIPTLKQGHAHGIGHSYNNFLKCFIEIQEENRKNKPVKHFAVVLYDFHDQHIREVLNNKDGAAHRNRLSENNISLFFLTSNDQQLLKSFNDFFLSAFNITNAYKLPFVLFFDVKDKEIADIEIIKLEQKDLTLSVKELYECIDSYKERKISV